MSLVQASHVLALQGMAWSLRREESWIMAAKKWPKRTVVYLHSSKESMFDRGKALGLSEDACHEFKYCGYEIRLDVEVNKDGTFKVLGLAE